jgi:hypothetical protein
MKSQFLQQQVALSMNFPLFINGLETLGFSNRAAGWAIPKSPFPTPVKDAADFTLDTNFSWFHPMKESDS